MVQQFQCPACWQSIYFPEFFDKNDELLESICTNCKYRYGLTCVEVLNSRSSLDVFFTHEQGKKFKYKRTYQLRVLKGDKSQETLRFSTSNTSEKTLALTGDKLLLLYLTRSNTAKELMLIRSIITGESSLISSPNARARAMGLRTAVTTFAGGLLLATITHLPIEKVFFPTVISSVGVGAYVCKLKEPKSREQQDLIRLSNEQKLLQQQFNIQQRAIELSVEIKACRQTLTRSRELRQKMVNQGELYAKPIQTLERSINVLNSQLDLGYILVDNYTHLSELLTIEYETLTLTEKLPQDIIKSTLIQMQELEILEEKRTELASSISLDSIEV